MENLTNRKMTKHTDKLTLLLIAANKHEAMKKQHHRSFVMTDFTHEELHTLFAAVSARMADMQNHLEIFQKFNMSETEMFRKSYQTTEDEIERCAMWNRQIMAALQVVHNENN
jgi:hypothetical protein